eukprot:9004306-Alexandrium_andersonii.AAC.1
MPSSGHHSAGWNGLDPSQAQSSLRGGSVAGLHRRNRALPCAPEQAPLCVLAHSHAGRHALQAALRAGHPPSAWC